MSEGAAPQASSIIPAPGSLTKSSPERTSRWPAPHRLIWEVTGTWVNGMLLAVCLLAGLFGWRLGPVVDGAPALPQLPMIVVAPDLVQSRSAVAEYAREGRLAEKFMAARAVQSDAYYEISRL
jgi:hypothetical protein